MNLALPAPAKGDVPNVASPSIVLPTRVIEKTTTLKLPTMHLGQARAFWKLKGSRFKALRCGRRWGKTDFAKIWIGDGLARGYECGWFAPHHKTWSEAFTEMAAAFSPILTNASKGNAVMRASTGGRMDFWTLENPMAGRSRRYHRVVIDEAAFTNNATMMDTWEKSIKPTLLDFSGEALVCSNSAGKNPDNFLYQICTDDKYGFTEHHAPTKDNPILPHRMQHESLVAWQARREQELQNLIDQNDPLVYAQEYGAEFVDWAGVAFFSEDKFLVEGQPWQHDFCATVFAVIDTAVKDGSEHDGTAVTYYSYNPHAAYKLVVIDWDIVQIEGALLETWLPVVFQNLEALAIQYKAQYGSTGAHIEDKASGSILLQQAARRGWRALPIESTLTAAGKDERCISISGYHYRGMIKMSPHAFTKVATFKRQSRNHFLDQVTSFRIGDKNNKRADDLLDTYTYGVSIALGNEQGQ